ncbi:MAG: hypothetical protein IJT39_06385, partial [Bacteroidales bacterium]|nr:hypothetical protein [Bacteroidales bacterium]
MNTKTRMWRGRPWLAMLLAVLLAWLVPQRAAARYVDDTYRYSVTLSGSNTITIKAPVYDEDLDDHWVCDGYIYVQVADKDGNYGSQQTLFWWREDESSGGHNNKDTDLWCKFYTGMEGSFDITQGNSGNHFTLTKDDETVRRKVYENNDGETYDFTAVWRVPYDLLGKKLKITWSVKCDYTNGLAWDTRYSVSPTGTEITLPKAQDVMVPQVTMATVSYSEVGRIELPWFMSSTNITAIHYEYVDANANLVKQDMRTNENNGTLYLDAIVPHNDFKIVVDYKDNSGYEIKNVASTPQDLQMIHAPIGLTATPLSGAEANRKAKVRLEWMIQHRSTDDIAPSDFFEVQRSLTGKEADFVTIGSVPLALDTTFFSYVDSTLISALTAEQLTGGGTLDSLTYRVRRMVTQNWGWEGNPCAASARTVVNDLHLLRLKTYSAEWADKRAFTVRVKWEYADEYHAVWDDRAKLMMLVTMKNNAGETIETKTFELTSDERAARQKVIDLSRPCLKYDIKMYVDPGTSPLKNYEDIEKYYIPIRSEADWNTFRTKVQDAKGQYDVNARLYADI